MEVRALCTSLSVNVFLLLVVHNKNCFYAKRADGAFLRLDPSRLQFFEYESIQLNCEGLDFSTKWRVMRKLKENLANAIKWETSRSSITINPAYASNTGEYWCENEEGDRSNSVNITVTPGDVILESPSVPVMEGDSVSLQCRSKNPDQNPSADFFKDGTLIGIEYEGTFTISNVSKSDEGFYKCSISGAGESPESWLSVSCDREIEEIPGTPPSDDSRHQSIVLSAVLAVLFLAGLLLVVDPFHHQKAEEPGFSSTSADRTFMSGVKLSLKDNDDIYSTILYSLVCEKQTQEE